MPILELNPGHALVKKLDAEERFDDLAQIIFDQALLAEGGQLEEPAADVQRVNRMLTAAQVSAPGRRPTAPSGKGWAAAR